MTVKSKSRPVVPPPPRATFKSRQFAAREHAILDAANGLLVRKGYDLMSLDDIAAEVGIAKGSLYRHFPSKEALAGAAMTRLLLRTLDYARTLAEEPSAATRLRSLLHWCLRERIAGAMPSLPATRSSLTDALLGNAAYVEAIGAMNELLLGWIEQAKAQAGLRTDLDDEVILFTLYARTCDPTLDFLKAACSLSDDEIVESMLEACFGGIAG